MDRISQLKEFLKTEINDSFLQHALALEYIKIGKDEEAQKLFDEILSREPGYLGSYYHLGKLLERKGIPEKALEVYRKGMEIAGIAGDRHSYNELQSAFNEALDE